MLLSGFDFGHHDPDQPVEGSGDPFRVSPGFPIEAFESDRL
jgi:hypothetical protein